MKFFPATIAGLYELLLKAVCRLSVVLMSILRKIYYSCLLTLIAANVAAQNVEVSMQPVTKLPLVSLDSSAKLAVRKIIITGNKKTKDYMILREIQFKPGDSIIIGNLNDAFQLARQQVYNTTLFHEVKVELSMISAYEIDVIVTVKERWYFFPSPQFQIVDRSFNEWLVKYKGDLSRVNYGLKFVHYNFSGRRDPLRLFLINGYTKNLSFSYSQPYSNGALTQGFGIGGGFSQNREIAYKTTSDNKILFFKNENFVKKDIYFNLSFRLQKGILFRHLFNVAYSRLTISDSIIFRYNPNYFNASTTKKGLIDLSYTYQYTNVNNVTYPLKGVTSYLMLSKRGLGFTGGTNLFSIEGAYNKYWALHNNWFGSLQFLGNIKLPFDQPYINQRAIGYGNATLRGLEFYVIDGVAFGIFKSTLKKKLVSFSIPVPFKSSRIIPSLPFTIFAKTYADAGFSYNKKKFDTNLNNRFLYTGGFGIDILTLYDINLKIEYSFNQLGQRPFFFESR
ncbi:MAG: POTRA domain-containing protein [Ferruginibacter sp.]